MIYLTLQDIKQHLNIDQSYTGEDTYLTQLEEVAEDAVEQHLQKALSAYCQTIDGEVQPSTLPKSIRHALLLYTATLYDNREQVKYANATQVPFTYDYLLQHYINYANK